MLVIENLSVSYGETLILRDVNLEVRAGEVVCLLGRNGVGKTTLLKSIMGLLRPRSGRILFSGLDLTRTSPDQRARAGIGYVPQGREIFPQLSVQENLQIGLLAAPRPGLVQRFSGLIQWLFSGRSRHGTPGPGAAMARMDEYFPALANLRDRKGGVLSGGQQQQLAIARALIGKPKLLILDEPTEGIQPSVITLIGEVLESLKHQGQAILLVEQYLEFATRLADSYYVMEKGAIMLKGKSADSDKEVIKPYLAF